MQKFMPGPTRSRHGSHEFDINRSHKPAADDRIVHPQAGRRWRRGRRVLRIAAVDADMQQRVILRFDADRDARAGVLSLDGVYHWLNRYVQPEVLCAMA
jgi:hypothetical protein